MLILMQFLDGMARIGLCCIRNLRSLASVAALCVLAGCASSPNTPSTYDPSTAARLRLYFDWAYPVVIFNRDCYPVGYEPDLDVLDTHYRWDFASNKTIGIPPPGRDTTTSLS